MIVVIADDLTGAAELGGIGLRYNLNVEVALEVNPSSTADLLVISTDTRSKSEADAVAEMAKVSKDVLSLRPEIVFKKVDSVLRGHIVPELTVQMEVLKRDTALLVPANPALGRTIEDGIYHVHGKPLAETAFKDDPEFPLRSSVITQILPTRVIPLKVRKHSETLDETGIIVGEASNKGDLDEWTRHSNNRMLLAGGSGFFSALLASLNIKEKKAPAEVRPFQGNKLYVCGTAFTSSAIRVSAIANKTGLVHYLPASLVSNTQVTRADIQTFSGKVSKQINEHGTAVIAIAPQSVGSGTTALQLRERMALLVRYIFEEAKIDELIIEGGSTASAIFNTLEFKRLFPLNEYAPGVIRCRAEEPENLYITLKPGSYNWPKEVWIF
jgi:D-threonate/D-erythronate kinase